MRFSLCVVGLLLGTAVVQAAPVAKSVAAPVVAEPLAERDGLRISIVPTSAKGNIGIIDLKMGRPSINVRLQNTSNKPLRLYEDWNSWGFYNLNLEITKVDGKVLDKPLFVGRGWMYWLNNFPSLESIKPHTSLVRVMGLHIPSKKDKKVSPNALLYLGFPLPPANGTREVTMQAIFQNPGPLERASAFRRKNSSMWRGKIASQPMRYRIKWNAG